MTEPQPDFLDVPFLLDMSQPRARAGWFWYALGGFLLVVLISAWASGQSSAMAQAVNVLSGLLMIGVMTGMALMTWLTVRRHRAEQLQLEAIEELVLLRRWPQAAVLLQGLLSQPTRAPGSRVQGLLFLGSVLARYHRFDEAIVVHNHLLDEAPLDPGTDYAVRLSRAMAMLRVDHLFDADRAIADLRKRSVVRSSPGEDEAPDTAARQAPVSGGLELVELYRDVKTGHSAEAIERFHAALPVYRRQLGHRVADAYALVAVAHDTLKQTVEAQQMYEAATLLAPPVELHRRYPEVARLESRYQPAIAPPEAA